MTIECHESLTWFSYHFKFILFLFSVAVILKDLALVEKKNAIPFNFSVVCVCVCVCIQTCVTSFE